MVSHMTIIRAFELPLQRIQWDMAKRANSGPMPEEWDGWKLLRDCWKHSVWLANWCVQQLQLHDAGKLKLGDGFLYTYGFTEGNYPHVDFWKNAKGEASAVIRSVMQKYKQEKKEVSSLARIHSSYRSFPFPIRSQAWKEAGIDCGGKPWVRISLPGAGVFLRLRGGPEFARQMALFREVVKGERPRLQMQLVERRKNGDSHRPATKDGSRVMVKMVAKFEEREKPGGRPLVLVTDPQAFLIAELDGRQAWVLNADHCRRLVNGHAEHLSRLQRLSQDCKAERRLHSNRAKGIAERMESLCHKHHNRMASLTHEVAAHVVGFAQRNQCGEIFYLDRDRGFVSKFPWAELHGKIAQKCEMAGITLFSESGAGIVAVLAEENGTVDVESTTTKEDDRWHRITKLREKAGRKLLTARRRSGSSKAVSAP